MKNETPARRAARGERGLEQLVTAIRWTASGKAWPHPKRYHPPHHERDPQGPDTWEEELGNK